MIDFKLYFYILLFYLIFCNNIIVIRSQSASCLDYNGIGVDWWFLLSKQAAVGTDESIVGGGYLYVDSNGIEADIDNNLEGTVEGGEDDQVIRTIKELLEQHTDTAYEDNKPVFDACTEGEYKLSKNRNKGSCTVPLGQYFNAQTWYHDTTEQQDNVISANNRVNNRKSTGSTLTREEKDAKFESVLEDDDIDRDGESYGEEKARATRRRSNIKSRGPIKSRYLNVIKEKTYRPETDSSRFAHSKFLVSVDITTGDGYILDHSANIPSFSLKTGNKLYKPFAKPTLLSDTIKKQGSEGKFVKSHHFFCFNFQQVDFNSLMNIIKKIKPRFVMSNYIGKNFAETSDVSLIPHTYDVKQKLSGYVTNDVCSNYYKNLYKQAVINHPTDVRVTSNYLVKELLDKTTIDDLIRENCLSKYTIANHRLSVYAFNSRNKPEGWDDKLNKEVSNREDNYKLLGPHLTYNSYGLDPYTVVARERGGPFYVSTMAQAGRVEIPSIKTKHFSLYVLKSWKGDEKKVEEKEEKETKTKTKTKKPTKPKVIISSNRHEKLLFAHESNDQSNIVMTGDANRNVVHSLYAGINIVFRSTTLANLLRSKVHAVTTYNIYDQNPASNTNKITKTEYTFGAKLYKPGFIHSLISQNEIVNLQDGSSSDDDSPDDVAGSGSDSDVDRESRIKPRKKKNVVVNNGKSTLKNRKKEAPVKADVKTKKKIETKTDAKTKAKKGVKRDRSVSTESRESGKKRKTTETKK